MRLLVTLGLLTSTLASSFSSSFADSGPGVFRRIVPPGTALAFRAEHPAAFAAVDREAIRRFREAGGGSLAVPLADGSELVLSLARFEILAPGARVLASGPEGEVPIHPDLTLFRGGVAGDPDGWAVVSMSGGQVMGVISTARGRFEIAPPRDPGGAHVIAAEAALASAGRRFECPVDDPASRDGDGLKLREAQPEAGRVTPTRLVCDVALDCDYEYYANKFGGDLTQATNYILTVLGTASLIYERDINVTLRAGLLVVWTTPSDPWTVNTLQGQLEEYRGWWIDNRPGVHRDVAHLVSGRSLGGGIAYLDGLCNYNFSFAVSSVYGTYSYPTNSATWDLMVIAHEIGHNFSSAHTHSCWWQDAGYAPSGALLDSCYTAEGTCYSGPTGLVPPDKGTIMSYCHTLFPGMSNIRLDFHSACRSRMREFAQGSCLPADSLQPPRDLIATTAAAGTVLQWAASPSPGVIRYDVFRSPYMLDLDPALLGSITTTAWVDSFPGPYYYKVRAVRESDQSEFSNEATAAPCGPGSNTGYAAGNGPVAMVAGDFYEEGIVDLAIADSAGACISVLQGLRCPTCPNDFNLPTTTALGAAPRALVTADFNADGIADLAVAGGGLLTILRGQGVSGTGFGTFAPVATYALSVTDQSALAVADFDEDGISDLALADGNGLTILIGQGSGGVGLGTFAAAAPRPVGPDASGIAAGDFNADGITDLAVSFADSAAVFLGQGTGAWGDGTFATPVAYAAGSASSGIATGDFDEDGITDLAVANAGSGNVSVLRGLGSGGDGDGTFAAATSYPCGAGAAALAVCDVDQDGIADLVTANAGENTISVLYGQGSAGVGDGTFGAPEQLAAGSSPRALVARDFNEDGRPDLAVADRASPGTVRVSRMSCAGALPTGVAVTAPEGGEQWITGAEHVVSWTRGAGVISVDLEVSRDGGANWLPLATGLTNSSWAWTVNGPYSTSVRFRAYDPTAPTREDRTDSSITVLPEEAVSAEPVRASALRLAGAWPNPTSRELAVQFTLKDASPATLEVFDLAGRSLAARAVGSLGPGAHRVRISEGLRLEPGVYLLRLTQGARAVSAKAVVLE